MNSLKSAALAIILSGVSLSAQAIPIVDTGPGDTNPTGLALDSFQFLAGRFTIAQAWEINSLEGWIAGSAVGRTATAAIYSDLGNLPSTELFSAAFTDATNSMANWTGAFGLSWLLPAGTYWATFEVRPGQTLTNGTMPGSVSNPLTRYAFFADVVGAWQSFGGFSPQELGFRINASDPAALPEPGTLGLLGFGLAGAAWIRRRKLA